MAEPFRVLSYGAGIDSTTLLLMSHHGELPRLDAAIFSDTQAEPRGVYETVEWVSATIDIPLYRVSTGSFTADLLGKALGASGRHVYPPFFVRKDDGLPGAPLHRRCTTDYKILPIKRQLRALVGSKGHVEQWIGFSLDDMGRTFCSDVQWITNVFPLILPKRMRRRDCIAWLKEHGYPIPMKSSCTFCPYHSNAYWREMRDTRPGEWQETVAFESQLHAGKLPGVRGIPFLHKSMVPLPMAPIDVPDVGQEELFCMHCNT